ncbi:MAG TPA: hypothetical protein VF168_10300 [Trueperaceae bacterium]
MNEFAHYLHERGAHQQLWDLLQGHDSAGTEQEDYLFWRLASSVRLDLEQSVRHEVEAYLAENEAPDLRALYASVFLEPAAARSEITRACRSERTPLTVYLYGRVLPRARDGVRVLGKAVKLAESKGHPYEVTRAAGTLTARLIDAGEFVDAVRWGEWALAQFDRLGLSDLQRRLYILNNWAYARIMTGQTAGLEGLLREAQSRLGEAFSSLKSMFRSTLADYLMATDRVKEALDLLVTNFDMAPRKMKGIRGLSLVRGLFELGRDGRKEALEVAREAYSLTRLDSWEYHRSAVLALGMALAFEEPANAVAHLDKVLQFETLTLPAPQMAQARLYLALARAGLPGGEASAGDRALFRKLSKTGLKLLSGPESHFADIWADYAGRHHELELRFLGDPQVLVKGARKGVGSNFKNILALLAYYSEGLSADRLLTELGWSTVDREKIYSYLSKLRNVVPVSPPPYRLDIEWRADFVEVGRLLEGGGLRKAVQLYRGPLLPESDAPGIEEIRSELDEKLRQAALKSDDAEACYALAGILEEDLELWERAADLLDENDPRILKARTRVSRLQREF